MARYTTKRKYSKKPTTKFKKIVKRIKKETVQVVEPTNEPLLSPITTATKSIWNKAANWAKNLFKK